MCLLVTAEAILRSLPNTTALTRATDDPTDIPRWMRESLCGLSLTQEERPLRSAVFLILQCQTASPENSHTSDTIQTEQGIFRDIYVYTYMQIITNEKGAKGNMKGLGGRNDVIILVSPAKGKSV